MTEDSSSARAAPAGIWHIGPDTAPVSVENADAVLAYLPYYLGGWPVRWAEDAAGDPDVRVTENADGIFHVISSGPGGADFEFDNPYDAANGLAGALISVSVARQADQICLHAGAAVIDGGLAIVVGDSFSGKSSVALHLTVLGNRFFGDDQIAVSLGEQPHGVCLGLTPKVRLPLPPDSGEAFRQFVEGYTSMEGDDDVYLKLWDGEAATYGETAPVRALVFLDRRPDGGSDLTPATRTEMLKSLVAKAYAPHIPPQDLLSALARLADTVGLYHLRYSSSRDAAALLSRTLRQATQSGTAAESERTGNTKQRPGERE